MEVKSSKRPKFKWPTNPLTDEGMKALVIVLGAIALISGAFYLAEFKERQESVVLPATVEVIVAPEATKVPTEIPGMEPTPIPEETSEATAGPRMDVTASPSTQF